MMAILIAAGMALRLAEATEPKVVVVRVTGAPLESVACQIVNEPDPTAGSRLRRTASAIEWSCLPGDRLQCDVPALEPIDVSADSCASGTARLNFQRSGMATIDVDGPSMVEWRAETPKGTRAVAIRHIDGPAKIPVAIGGRIVRLYRGQASPVSIHVVPGSRVQIEPPKSGGELFGRIERKTISPSLVSISGPFESSIPIDSSGRFSLAGIPPGDYEVAPVYAGGIKPTSKQLRIESSRTSEIVDLVSESVGGVVLVVLPEVCDATGRLVLTRVQAQTRSARFDEAFRKPLAEGCDWHLEGLKPGRYEATISAQQFGDLKAAEDFVIENDRLAWASLGEPRVTVEGRVMLGEKPGTGLLLAFQRADSSGRLWVTETGADGRYRLGVDKPGRYAVEVRAARRLGAESHLAQLREGLNQFDLTLSETRLTVKLQRADRGPIDEIVQVHILGGTRDRSGVVLPGEGTTFDFAGIPYGNYLVTADTNSGMVSLQEATAVVSKAAPETAVVLTLGSRLSELRLIASDRSPVQGARVQVNARILSELAPGVFEVKSASPGTEMLVSAPGLVPICHVLTAGDFPQSTLVMTRGTHAAEIRFTPPISGPLGEITGLPGSTCPVPLGITSFGATEDTVSTTVRIVGLPEGRFSYTPTRVSPPQVMEVPGPPLSFTKPKPQF